MAKVREETSSTRIFLARKSPLPSELMQRSTCRVRARNEVERSARDSHLSGNGKRKPPPRHRLV